MDSPAIFYAKENEPSRDLEYCALKAAVYESEMQPVKTIKLTDKLGQMRLIYLEKFRPFCVFHRVFSFNSIADRQLFIAMVLQRFRDGD